MGNGGGEWVFRHASNLEGLIGGGNEKKKKKDNSIVRTKVWYFLVKLVKVKVK